MTFSAGVPTVWLGLLNHMRCRTSCKFSTLKRTVIGGSACPPAMMRTLENEYGVEVIHAWGMTEMSPLGTLSRLQDQARRARRRAQHKLLREAGPRHLRRRHEDRRRRRQAAALGRRDLRQPAGARALGDRAATSRRRGSPLSTVNGDGWFPTGDVATIDADGFMQITDRSKDVIKSGGEWISSIDLENIAMAHPAVHEAAVIGVPAPEVGRAPAAGVVKKPGAEVTREELLGFFEGKIAKWQMPDDVVVRRRDLPHTAHRQDARSSSCASSSRTTACRRPEPPDGAWPSATGASG